MCIRLLVQCTILFIGIGDVTAARQIVFETGTSASGSTRNYNLRSLRAEDVSSTSVNVEEYMSTLSSSSATATTTASQVRQSTTTSQPNNVISLPSFTLILGPLTTLSSNTGSLLSIENNIAIRSNTVSGPSISVKDGSDITLFGCEVVD